MENKFLGCIFSKIILLWQKGNQRVSFEKQEKRRELPMSLYSDWMEKSTRDDGNSIEAVWEEYLPKEQKVYESIIGQKITKVEGTVKELAERFHMDCEATVAFIDGINDVLPTPYDMETLTEDSQICLDIDFEKLFKKMVEYRAEHLYTLPQWNGIFDEETRKRLTLEQKRSRTVVKGQKIGRNDPCPCGSGKKYKKCCGANL